MAGQDDVTMITGRELTIRVLITAVRCYQVAVRPLLVGGCRFVPTCSEYFIEAVRIHGPLGGLWLGLKRICRCRPGGAYGYDPVPPGEEPRCLGSEFDRRCQQH